MLFNSIGFACFLPIVFMIYWFVVNRKLIYQNVFLLFTSYLFYAFWDWRFLILIFLSTVVDFMFGNALDQDKNKHHRKKLLFFSLAFNLGLLAVFKYHNFFVENFISAFSFIGLNLNVTTLNIILPVGISFYTFQTLSYTIDIYNKRIQPTSSFINFAVFVSFFPQLVAGPIERAKNFLPQFENKRNFEIDEAKNGLRQILWGLLKKIVIADNAAIYVNQIFEQPEMYSGSTLLLGAIFFSFQIYGDFSGYSDIAIGTARLFGFKLKQNFAFPYFSRNIIEFWRRWHISLSSWFKDYLYIPLGGRQTTTRVHVRNILIVFIISGFWHGANWTFIIWGLMHAILYLVVYYFGKQQPSQSIEARQTLFPRFKNCIQILTTFIVVTLTWICFRAEQLSDALLYYKGVFSQSLFSYPEIRPRNLIIILLCFILIEWHGRYSKYALEHIGLSWPRIARWMMYYGLILFIYLFGNFTDQIDFIYFQF